MTDVQRDRPLTPSEIARVRRVMHREELADKALNDARDARDQVLRELRWGVNGNGWVSVRRLMDATRCRMYPDGLSRPTVNRVVGRVRDQQSTNE